MDVSRFVTETLAEPASGLGRSEHLDMYRSTALLAEPWLRGRAPALDPETPSPATHPDTALDATSPRPGRPQLPPGTCAAGDQTRAPNARASRRGRTPPPHSGSTPPL